MKRISILIFLFYNSSAFAQDVIFFKNGSTTVHAKVLRITPAHVIYRLYNEPDTVERKEHKIKIESIMYQNGDIEYYDNSERVINDADFNPCSKEPSVANNILSDKIFFSKGRIANVVIIEIKQNSVLFKRYSNPGGPVYEDNKVEIEKIVYANYKGEKFNNRNKSVFLDSVKANEASYFIHSIKINPFSAIMNELTFKYEYRFNKSKGLQVELGYIHPLKGLESDHSQVFPNTEALPFAYQGFIVRAGFRSFICPVYKTKNRSISFNLFYKNQVHKRLTYFYNDDSGYDDWARNNVYGLTILYSVQKYFRHFMLEFYGGASLRYVSQRRVLYAEFDDYGHEHALATPEHSIINRVWPAIQGGINIGFGFNGKKKSG